MSVLMHFAYAVAAYTLRLHLTDHKSAHQPSSDSIRMRLHIALVVALRIALLRQRISTHPLDTYPVYVVSRIRDAVKASAMNKVCVPDAYVMHAIAPFATNHLSQPAETGESYVGRGGGMASEVTR